MNRQLFKIIVAIMTTLLALLIFWQFRGVVMIVLLSLLLAEVLRPLTQMLKGKRLLARAALLLLGLVGLGCFALFLFYVGKSAGAELKLLGKSLSAQNVWVLPVWLEGSAFQLKVMSQFPPPSILFEAFTGDQGQQVLPALLGFVKGFGSIVAAGIVIFILSLYWSINKVHFERLWLSLLPSDQRKQPRGIWHIVQYDLSSYFRAELVQGFLAGFLLGTGYWLLGSPFPVLLALIGAIASMIPVVGIAIAVIAPLVIGLLTSAQLGLLSVLLTLVILTGILFWIRPRLSSHQWRNPILTAVLLVALADAFGLLGIIIAPPISVFCQILWRHVFNKRSPAGSVSRIPDLRDRLAKVNEAVSQMEEPRLPLVTSSVERLSKLLAEAAPLLDANSLVNLNEPLSPLDSLD